jgi:O-antigen ligase
MPPEIATFVCVLGIVGLFFLDRDREVQTSKALWLPVVWLLLAGSRAVSQWLAAFGLGPVVLSTPEQYLEGSPLDRDVLAGLLVLGLIVLVRRGPQVGRLVRANGPVLLFFFYCGLSVLWSDYPDVAFKRWIKAVGDLVMVLIVLTDSEPLAALKRLLTRTAFLLLPLSVLFIKYYPDLGRSYSNSWELMYKGVTDHKNTLGMICLVFGLGFLWRFLEHYRTKGEPHRRRHLLAHGAMLAMLMWLFWMVNSMTSLSCFLMAGGLLAVMNLHKLGRKLAFVHLLVLAVLSVSLIALFSDFRGSLLATMGRDSTLTGRTDIWRQVLAMDGRPLFGFGYESFWLGERLERLRSDNVGLMLNEAHNSYIEVYLNLGWCGVTLLAVLILTGYRNVIVSFRRDPHVGGLKLAYFVAAVIYSLTEAGFRMMAPVWIFFLLATIAVPEAEAAVTEGPLALSVEYGANFSECESQVDYVPSVGFREGTI